MSKKVYAVRQGRTPGLFFSWKDCQASVAGYSGAEYKSFSSEEEARAYLNGCDKPSLAKLELSRDPQGIVAYVDGSYDNKTERYAYGCVIIEPDGKEILNFDSANDPEGIISQNVAGELQGALFATNWALERGYLRIDIYHDLEGTSKWATGEWKARTPVTKDYVSQMKKLQEQITVTFHKVQGHSNDHYNDLADSLARRALKSGKERSIKKTEYCVRAEGISYDELSTIIEIMMEDNEKLIKTEEEMPHFKRVELRERKDKVTIHHYSNKSNLMIQGKSNKLLSTIITYLNELSDLGDTTDIYRNSFNVTVDKQLVEEQCKTYLPYGYSRLPEKMSRVLRQAVLHLSLSGDFFDSAFLAFPALRVLEGHLKNILYEQGIVTDVSSIQHNGFYMFKKVEGVKYELDPELSPDISSHIVEYMNRCYSFYRNNRHTVFHWDDPTTLDTTRIVESAHDAHAIITRTLTLIDEYYKIA